MSYNAKGESQYTTFSGGSPQHHPAILEQDVNKMNASNLAIVFWPTLMRPALRDLADPSKHIAWQLALAKVIENPDLVPAIDYV